MGAFGIFRHIAERKAEAVKKGLEGDRERQDGNLPLGIKINTIVEIDTVPFVLYGGKWNLEDPGGSNTVVAVGKFKIMDYDGVDDMDCYRFYMESNDGKLEHSMIQITTNSGKPGEIVDMNLYRVIDEICPQTKEEWDDWLNPEDGMIGWKVFSVAKKDGTKWIYDRLIGAGDRAKPLEFREKMILDPYGDSGMAAANKAMVYGRELAEDFMEYVFPAVVDIEDSSASDGAKVVIMAGFDIDASSLKVMA